MFRSLFFVLVASSASLASGVAQELPAFRLPDVHHPGLDVDKSATAMRQNAVANYENPHEAAVAAFQAGYRSATVGKNHLRAMSYFLLAASRDPGYAKALFDLGAVCAQDRRWQDAQSFYHEAGVVDPSPEMQRLSSAEEQRMQAVALLDSTTEGKRELAYDTELVALLAKPDDAVVYEETATSLIRRDAGRWEGHAILGLVQASLKRYAEAARSFTAAAQTAPPARQSALRTAAKLVLSDATFEEQLSLGDKQSDEQSYEKAATAYANAWQTNPARVDVGFQAAVAFLMADQVSRAVPTLTRLREKGTLELSERARVMLKELGAISDDARREADRTLTPHPDAGSADSASRIKALLGGIASPEVRLVAVRVPSLLNDETHVTPVTDDDLKKVSDAEIQSTTSIFAMYRRSAQAGAPPAAPVAAPAAAPGTTPTSIPGLDLPSPPPGSSAARTEEPSKDVPDVLSNRPAALKERDIPVPAKSKSAKKSKTQDNAPKQ